ncbi:PREDICTED: UDP-glucuronosyltransferase 2C1-like [Wasmannia auropunctata]|uniref:UDP-glucuronosyltransferase 2C1-like n=1 Tax=Wasmannia auropunctata TaxID=64793 RepID=UPI0005EF4E12|nr:PREDICTED: UDP-glucuronosyltransferase 2C1-like [Wasmannia auropunctata]
MKITTTSLVTIVCLLSMVNGARILAIFPFNVKSHYIVFEPLLKRLSARGHEIVAVTHFPQRIRLANFTDVDVSSALPSRINTIPLINITIWQSILRFMSSEFCEFVLSHPEIKRIINAKEHFDLLVIEMFASDCFLGIAHALNISKIVGAISSAGLLRTNVMLRNPENPSYIPNYFSSYTGRMNLLERSFNTVLLLIVNSGFRILSDRSSYEVARKYLGHDLPDFDALRSRISLILTNGHPAVSVARPLAPGVKEIGGIHIPISGPKPLPMDLQDYLDSQSRNGVIYFSLGSQIDTSTIPNQVFAALYRAFEQVPQQILWTCAKERMPPLPGNVKCIGWAPQLSVLCHSNTRLLIYHGGLLGLQEAIYCGVPILGIPVFGDHRLNMAYVVEKGLALQLDLQQFSYKRFSSSLNEILSNKSYTEMARKASFQFKDRLMSPVEEATYWVEHTIRHDPNFLKTAAIELTWYEYLLLDVALMMISIIVFALWLICKLFSLLFSKKKIIIIIEDNVKKIK